jgi:hypothetical protein
VVVFAICMVAAVAGVLRPLAAGARQLRG